MPREKISVEFEIKKDLDQMLEYAAEKYKIKEIGSEVLFNYFVNG